MRRRNPLCWLARAPWAVSDRGTFRCWSAPAGHAEVERRDRHDRKTRKASIAVTAAILGLAACATPPPAEVETVAQSGIKFADSVSPLLNNALDGAIASNSDTLIMAHANASTEARRTALLEANSAYRERGFSPTSAIMPSC